MSNRRPKDCKCEAKPTGRPGIDLSSENWQTLENLCKIQCTADEIAAVLGISVATLGRRIKDEHKMTTGQFMKEHSQAGLASLRRQQWLKAFKGDSSMLKWCGIQHLGQSWRNEVSGSVEVEVEQRDENIDETIASPKQVGEVIGILSELGFLNGGSEALEADEPPDPTAH